LVAVGLEQVKTLFLVLRSAVAVVVLVDLYTEVLLF
jgi:hypothetical protein